MNKFTSFISFLLSTTKIKSLNEGFLKDFCTYILDTDIRFYHFDELEGIRNSLLNNNNLIKIVDLGAGSSYGNENEKRISDVAKQQLSKAYQLQVISRIIQFSKAQKCVELGASLGLSSLYMSRSTSGEVYSFEGNPHFIDLINYQKGLLKIENLNLISGNFDDTLDTYLSEHKNIDFAFIDGNHRKDATIDYYNKIKKNCTDNAILIFDDIYWSKGMREAWETIKSDEKCTSSVDLYFMGIIFLRKDLGEQVHIRLRPKKWF